MKKIVGVLVALFFVVLLLVIFFRVPPDDMDLEERDFATVVADVKAGQIVEIRQSGRRLTVEKGDGTSYKSRALEDVGAALTASGETLLPAIVREDVSWQGRVLSILLLSLPGLLFLLLGWWVYRRFRERKSAGG